MNGGRGERGGADEEKTEAEGYPECEDDEEEKEDDDRFGDVYSVTSNGIDYCRKRIGRKWI